MCNLNGRASQPKILSLTTANVLDLLLTTLVQFFHYSLPQYLQSELESVQKRALACVFPRMPYREALERACLTSIREHHEDITKSLFRSISKNQNSKLHHLIPEAYSPHYNFRRQRTYNVPAAKTKRFANSFFVKCAAETNSSLR